MIIDDYHNYLQTYKEKYGDNTVILMQVGSFFEMYSIDNNDNYIYKISDICNIQISRKNKSITEVSINNPLMCGFPLYCLNKYVQLILQNNYTIVLIEQTTEPPNPERKITEIISPSTNISLNNKKSNYIIVVYFEYINNFLIVGISGVDLSTASCFVYETGSSKNDPCLALDETYRILSIYNPTELLIISDDNLNDTIKENIINIINVDCLIHYKWNNYEHNNIIKKINYQNQILEKAYNPKTMLNIIEYLNLEKLNIARISFCGLLQFAYEHNADIIKKLNVPTIIENNKILTIEFNSALQLNIISLNHNEKPLLDILNRCSTAFGSRTFKERLLNPIININSIEKRYNDIDFLLVDNKFKELTKILNNICDLERIKRKMIMNKFNPIDWCNFNTSLEFAIEAFKIIDNNTNIHILNNIIDSYNKFLNLEECSKYNLNDIKGNIFKNGIFPEIDELAKNSKDAYNGIIDIINNISNIEDNNNTSCKIEFNEREGYFISITKKRYDNALNKNKELMSKFDKKCLSSTNTNYKLTSKQINKFSEIIEKNQLIINNLVLKEYQKFVSSFIISNDDNLTNIINFLTDLDINCCNAKNAFEFRYYRPKIVEYENSFINAENLRHPIIEILDNRTEYIGNDVKLDKNGILLYGINASGKSSFMKAVGLNIIMAQSGMFVPSTTFEYYPFNHIMTRISGMDNIYKSMSSFIVEMSELRNILQRCDKNSLVIGDEICCGTEAISGVCIVSSAINELVKKNASFIFTSHLHELTNINIIKNIIDNNKLKIYHMHITRIDNKIIYERKLKDGQGSSIYGIEVCKSLDMPNDFMLNAENIRKELQGLDDTIITTKTSNYNTNLFMDLCSVCNKNKSIDTHHINYQALSDTNGFFENYHKNNTHNLVRLCKECHDKEHNNTINIIGYVQTNEGIKLNIKYNSNDYEKLFIYIRKGKINWYSRKQKNSKFTINTEENIINLINKLTKKNIKEIDEELSNKLFDFTF